MPDFGGLFSNVLNRYGLGAALLAVALLAAIFLITRYALAELENNREDRKAKLALAAKDLESKDNQRRALVAEIAAAREQNLKIVENHLAHDAEDRRALLQVLAEIKAKDDATVQAMRELTESVREDRAAAAQERKTLHERLNLIHLDVRERKAA